MTVLKDNARRSLAGTVHVRGGTIAFGADMDTILSRQGSNTLLLATGDQFKFAGGTTVITTNGTVLFGIDTNLYRVSSQTDQLRTDDDINIGDIFRVTRTGGTITWGSGEVRTLLDTNLYRSAANTLKTDDNFQAASGITTKEATGAVAVASLSANGDIQVQMCGGTPRVIARLAGTTYFWNSSG